MQKALINSNQSSSRDRLIFFDNLRTLFVCGVVFQHSAMAYIDSGWWPVEDGFSIIIGLLVAFTDGFLMPGLFYISGYFALVSIARKGSVNFIRSKFKRLGTAWLACTLFIGPILPLVYHYTHDPKGTVLNYLQMWQTIMKNALKFDFGLMPPKATVMQNDLFYQRYMWFIGLLLAFYLLLSLGYTLKKEWFHPNPDLAIDSPSANWTLSAILLIGLTTFLGSTGLIAVMFLTTAKTIEPDSTWFTLANLVQFRVSRIILHGTYFILGLLTGKYRWLERNKLPGHGKTWGIAFFLVASGYYIFFILCRALADDKALYSLFFWFCLNFFTITAIGLSLYLAVTRFNTPAALKKMSAADSFSIYLAHYPIVIILQLLFAGSAGIPLLLKYFLTAIVSFFGAYAAGRFLIKPYPRATILLLIFQFIILIHLFKT